MSNRYKGGVISATPPTLVAGAGASGTWTLEQQMQANAAGLWPVNGPFYIEDVFSTYLYTGNGSTQTITNGIDLSTKGGLVWIKARTNTSGGATSHALVDSVRGTSKWLSSNATSAEATNANLVTGFTTSGFSVGNTAYFANENTIPYVSWTFREQPKFFDIVTYTGNGTAGRTIAHNLGSVPGCIIVKQTSASGQDWMVYHRSLATNDYILLNSTGAASTYPYISSPTSTTFTVESAAPVNANGATYVAYIFAHDAGGFGLTGTDNVISCGSFTATGGNVEVNLGYEPQWVLVKNASSAENWRLLDNMRGISTSDTPWLFPNTSGAETSNSNWNSLTATGINFLGWGSSGNTYIYIAIRRGPMKVPTVGTSVFTPIARTGNGTATTISGAQTVVDAVIDAQRLHVTSGDTFAWDRLRGANNYVITNGTSAENAAAGATTNSLTGFDVMNGFRVGSDSIAAINSNSRTYINWIFSRAPSFFDEVCYTGTGVDLTVNHNLGVVPEWVIIKNRSRAGVNWSGAYFANPSEYYDVRLNQDIGRSLTTMGPLGPTLISNSTTTFGVYGGATTVNFSGDTYVAYLFATCPGVSKVGTYTGTATTLQIDCGFTAGSRFVLIKRTDSTGDWYVWDSARGIVAGNDPYLLLNSSDAEVTGTDYVDTYNAGFEISSTAPAGINANGGTYIFLAIA